VIRSNKKDSVDKDIAICKSQLQYAKVRVWIMNFLFFFLRSAISSKQYVRVHMEYIVVKMSKW